MWKQSVKSNDKEDINDGSNKENTKGDHGFADGI